MEVLKISNNALKKAVIIIRGGGVVIFPTDTVYGFLADAQNKKAVEKIYKIKKRSKLKPLSVFVKDIKTAGKIALIDSEQSKMLRKFWPGKYTFILKRKPVALYGLDKNTIALRIPKYLFLQKLLKQIDRPLVQTSVNISNQYFLNNINDIVATFGKSKLVAFIIDGGKIKNAKPSKIIDLTNNTIIRT